MTADNLIELAPQSTAHTRTHTHTHNDQKTRPGIGALCIVASVHEAVSRNKGWDTRQYQRTSQPQIRAVSGVTMPASRPQQTP
eukprot:6394516-Amphidinium_carterae.2